MLSGDEAYDAVVKATRKAANLYEKWACGSLLSDAGVESLIQTEIARELFASGKCYVTLETSFKHAVEWDETIECFNYPENVSELSRFDICVWCKDENLIGIIEVKRSKETWQLEKDMKRMSGMLREARKVKNSNLRYTMVAMYLWANCETKFKSLVKDTDCLFGNFATGKNSHFDNHEIKPLEKTDIKQSIAIAYFE